MATTATTSYSIPTASTVTHTPAVSTAADAVNTTLINLNISTVNSAKTGTCLLSLAPIAQHEDTETPSSPTMASNANVTGADEDLEEDEGYFLLRYPKEKSCFAQFTWLIIWPIHFLFCVAIPDCKKAKNNKIFPLTFVMCIVWIGSLSYVVAWMITIIGDTLKIPDSVMGITFLAAGTSVPEAVSSVIVAKRGHGSMGICNSIGSNTFDILLCLGVPWLIKAVFFPIQPGQNYVGINSAGLEYSAITLLSTLFLLYITFSCNKFKLDKRVGTACLVMYLVFLIFASLIELNVFFRVNLPTCGRS